MDFLDYLAKELEDEREMFIEIGEEVTLDEALQKEHSD